MHHPAHIEGFIGLMVDALVREIEGENAEGADLASEAPAAKGSEREEFYAPAA